MDYAERIRRSKEFLLRMESDREFCFNHLTQKLRNCTNPEQIDDLLDRWNHYKTIHQ